MKVKAVKVNRAHYFLTDPRTSNTFPIEQQIVKIHLSTSQHLHIANMYIPPKDFTQLSQTEEDSIISSMLTTITDLPNTIIIADVNTHSPLRYSPTEDHRGELIEHFAKLPQIILNTNTPTRLPPNQAQQPTLPNITTASADLHDYTNWGTIQSLTSDHLPLLITLSIHYKTKTTRSHFTKTIAIYQKEDLTSFKQHVEKLIFCRPHSTNVHEANKHLIKAFLDGDRLSFLKEITTAQTTFTYPCISASLSITVTIFANKNDQTHK